MKKTHPKEYSSWCGMKKRSKKFDICSEWKDDFIQFLADMGDKPEGTKLIRLDSEKGYSPSNCVWSKSNPQLIEKEIGKTYGRLTIRNFSHSNKINYFNCSCECGNKITTTVYKLKCGHTLSCGCLRKETSMKRGKTKRTHGLARTRVYYAWSSMKKRCYTKTSPNYNDYGGRGITVCDEWKNSFESFFADMGHPPVGRSLDRIDNDGIYEPSNCQWRTNKEQANNRRSTISDNDKKLARELYVQGYSLEKINKKVGRNCRHFLVKERIHIVEKRSV